MRTLILADDLTGALDSAVGFARGGRKVLVARHPEAVADAMACTPDVLAVNTASREIASEAAARRVATALSSLDRDAFSIVMKKVDSRLKGNIAAETAVLTDWMTPSRRIASPAIPDMGRKVMSGALTGSGVAEPIPVARRFDGAVETPDIASEADLDALVTEGGTETLWIGARGLAFALARREGIAAPDRAALTGPLMIANGSRDPVTRAQIAALPCAVTEAPDGRAPETPLPGEPLILSISDGGGSLTGEEAASRLADSIAHLAARHRPASLLICGGESAQAALDRIGISSLQVIAELRPGLPLCVVDAAWGKVRIVTKSGGFGAPDLLADILEETRVTS